MGRFRRSTAVLLAGFLGTLALYLLVRPDPALVNSPVVTPQRVRLPRSVVTTRPTSSGRPSPSPVRTARPTATPSPTTSTSRNPTPAPPATPTAAPTRTSLLPLPTAS
jgi:hypothetical protein